MRVLGHFLVSLDERGAQICVFPRQTVRKEILWVVTFLELSYKFPEVSVVPRVAVERV